MTIFKKITKGFTLLETLASIAVLSLVIIGPLSVTISSSGYARLTKDTIVATYLAEEAVELLQNQYDSLYIYCKKNASSTESGGYCDADAAPGGVGTETTTGQTAWRLFKTKLSSVPVQAGEAVQPTCYLPKDSNPGYTGDVAGNPNGCAFDYVNLQATSTQVLTRYDASEDDCKHVLPVTHAITSSIPVIGIDQSISFTLVTSTTTSYICSGTPGHIPVGGTLQSKEYIRTITVEQLPTFETTAANTQYNDDLRITSNVSFKGLNGVSHTVKIIRFMHARQ